jgi:uncharacterized protein YdhG (YjbR/CyaY superfamily)
MPAARGAEASEPPDRNSEGSRRKSTGWTKPAAVSHAAYLAALDPGRRAALEKLRADILAAAPGAEACVSYRLPAFRLDGRVLVGFGAAKDHCALYPMSGTTLATLGKARAAYATSKGTLRFPPEKPLPAALVKRIVKIRLAENRGK